MSVNVENMEQALALIEEWRPQSVTSQIRNLKMSLERLELSIMYYEQKGRDQGMERCELCVRLMRARLEELESD